MSAIELPGWHESAEREHTSRVSAASVRALDWSRFSKAAVTVAQQTILCLQPPLLGLAKSN